MHDLVIKTHDFSFVYNMHMLNIIVHWDAPNTTCVQQIFQVHSIETDELINSILVYVPIFRRYATHHVIWGVGEEDKKM